MQIPLFYSLPNLTIAACLVALALPAAATASESKEIEFARSVVKSKLETERTGAGIDWTNPETGKKGRLQLVETKILGRGLPCRWYKWSVKMDSTTKIETEGKGCRLAKGKWLLEETAVVRKTVRVKVPVEAKRSAPKPKDPMDGVSFTRPDAKTGIDPDKSGDPDSRSSVGATGQKD